MRTVSEPSEPHSDTGKVRITQHIYTSVYVAAFFKTHLCSTKRFPVCFFTHSEPELESNESRKQVKCKYCLLYVKPLLCTRADPCSLVSARASSASHKDQRASVQTTLFLRVIITSADISCVFYSYYSKATMSESVRY